MAIRVLIKPIISEKSEMLTTDVNQYSFVVDKRATKLQIKKSVEELYEVKVDSVNTMIMPSKNKNRNTKRGFVRGSVPSFKKAIVTVAEGEVIDFFGEV
ncbi:MAG: 50S ribosomal protein L23 [Saprospirales bacterium]|jgi:large subunit ribosomal protein L23|nr:MAG: 50S ribosomal protein L23 [Saprospirales bacterium]